MKNKFQKIKKKNHSFLLVKKNFLLLLSGIMWSSIGIFLFSLAYIWLLNYHQTFIYYVSGLLLAFTIHLFGFSKIAKKNINRINRMNKTKASIFAFQSLKSYGIIVVMISLGIFLRHSIIPKNYLAIVYSGIGGALFLSSFRYYRNINKV